MTTSPGFRYGLCTVAALVAFSLFCCCFTLRAAERLYRPDLTENDIQSSLGIRWYGIYLNKSKVGYLKEVREVIGEGEQKKYRYSFDMTFKMLRSGFTLERRGTEFRDFSMTPPYEMLGAGTSSSGNDGKKDVSVIPVETGFEAVIKEGDAERKLALGKIEYTLSDDLAGLVWVTRQKPEEGAEITTGLFDIDSLRPDRLTGKIKSVKETIVGGVPMTFYEMSATSFLRGPLGTVRVSDKGEMLSMEMGGLIEARLETEEVAKKLSVSQDLFVFGNAPVDKPLGYPKLIVDLVMEVEGEGRKMIASGPGQTVENGEDGRTLLKIGAMHSEPAKATAEEIGDNLKDTVEYPINEPAVRELAAKAVLDAKTPEEKVNRLALFVDQFVADDYNHNPPSVLDIIKEKRGDCSEHADLLTTLVRSCGIPARSVSGLVYMGDATRGFGWHAWTEVVLDGVWRAVDPSWGELRINATHIRVSSGRDDMYKVMRALGKLKFKAVTVNGKEVKAEEVKPDAPQKMPLIIEYDED